MAIGKPLLIAERKGIAQPVLSAQTQALNTNVPVQKLAMVDYSIGMNNAKASFAVSNELVGMVEAGAKAAIYIDKVNKDHTRLALTEEWQQSNLDYQSDFAQARTPQAQAGVIAAYQKDTTARKQAYIESQGTDLKAKGYLADLSNIANQQYSKFSVTQQNALFKQTASLHENSILQVAKSLTEDRTSDPVSGFQKLGGTYQDLVEMGQYTKEGAFYKFNLLKDEIIKGRAGMFADEYATSILADENRSLPTDDELKAQIQGVTGMELSDRRFKLVSDSFSDTYYKKLKAFNSEIAAEDAHNKEAISKDLAAFEVTYKNAILDGLLTTETKEELIKTAQQFDGVEDGYSGRIKVILDAVQFGTASQPQIDHFTGGQGGLDLQAVLHAGGKAGRGVDYYDLEAVEYSMRNAAGEYAGMNENTILGIVRYYRNKNAALITRFSERTPLLLKTNMVAAMQNPKLFLQSDEAGMTPEFWDAIKSTTSVNWESVFAQDIEYGKAFTRVQGVLAEAASSGTGQGNPFNKDEIGDDVTARTEALNTFIQQTIVTEFGAATAQKRDKVQAGKDKTAEEDRKASAAQSSGSFRFGGKTAKGKSYIGADDTSSKNLQDTLAAQGAEKYQAIKDRIQTDLKRMSYDAQPGWVKAIDSNIPNLEIKIGTPEFKAVARSIMGSTNTAYFTGLKNQQLKQEIEGMLERPLTEAELAGGSPLINEMASTVIKREESSSLGRLVRGLVSSTPSDSAKILENLVYEFKQKSLEGIQKGLEPVKPKTEAQPTPTQEPSTAIEDLVQGAEGNPLLQGAIELMSSVISPSDADAASTYQDPNFDPTAPGPRGLDAAGNPVDATRNELAQALGLPPDLSEDRFKGGTSEESDIEGFTGEEVDMPPVVMDEIVVSEQANKPQGSTPEDLFDAQLKSDTFTPDALQSKVGEAIKKIPSGSKNPQQIAQASMSIMPVLKLLAPVQTNVLTGYLTGDAPAHHLIAYGGRGAFYSAQNALGLLSRERKQNLTRLENFVTDNAKAAFSQELKKISNHLGLGVDDLKEHMKLILMSETNVGTNVEDSIPTRAGDRPAIGDLQVMATTFRDLIGKQFGEDAAGIAGLDYTELKKLKDNNDVAALESLLRNRNVNFVAGMAKMVQYLEVKANRTQTYKTEKAAKAAKAKAAAAKKKKP